MAVLLSDIDETIRKIFLTRNFKIKILRAYILCSNIDTLENILNCSVLKQYHLISQKYRNKKIKLQIS